VASGLQTSPRYPKYMRLVHPYGGRMAEIRVEPTRRNTAWVWILLVIVLIAAGLAYYFYFMPR